MALKSINEVKLAGYLGQDAKVYPTKNGQFIKFSIATTQNRKDIDGKWLSDTTWHNITAWNLSDDTINQLVKGTFVELKGIIKQDTYFDKNEQKKTSYYIFTFEVEVIIDHIKGNTLSPLKSIENVATTDNEEADLPF